MQEIITVKVRDLKPYENNAKIHSDYQIDLIEKSIKEFGFINPVLIDVNNNIIAGHGRVEAAKRIGVEEIPAIIIEGLTSEQQRAYIIADNRLGELATWDNRLVAEELQYIKDNNFDTDITGFSYDDIDFSFLDSDEKEDNKKIQKEVVGGQACECPRCKCLFVNDEILRSGKV